MDNVSTLILNKNKERVEFKTKKELEYLEYKKKYNFLMAEYIKQSEKLRIEINFEHDPVVMLDKALLCISFMTGDKVFYETNIKKVRR